jgi:multiple sugar transport system permease protein
MGPMRAIICYTLLIGIGAMLMVPLLWSVTTSLKSDDQIYHDPLSWMPNPIQWSNYYDAITTIPFFRYLMNTTIITLMCIIGTVISCTMVAFAFGCLKWPGRDILFVVMLATMMLPPQVVMIPQFVLFAKLGWLDSFKPLIVPAFVGGNAFFIFLLRQFYRTLPKDLFDSARIDGCSSFGIYWRIVLPLTRPAMMTVVIFTLNLTWNDFLLPLIYLTSDDKKTLALGLQSFQGQYGVEYSQLMALSTIMILPVVIVFFLGQRYFIEGITLTGIKG